jgi:hypothetical protein
MGIRQVTRTPLRGVEPRRVVARHVGRPLCVTADVGCTAAPVRALAPRRVWQDHSAPVGSTGCILQKVGRNKNAYASLSERVGSY